MRNHKFWEVNAVNYNDLPYSGENETDQDASQKKKWLSTGLSLLKATAQEVEGILVNASKNPSGSIDRGYISGFISSVDGTKSVYISLNDGMGNVLYRTAQHSKDYTGGSNNTQTLKKDNWERVINFVKENI